MVYFKVTWYGFSRFGMLYREKSGNSDPDDNWAEEVGLKCHLLKLERQGATKIGNKSKTVFGFRSHLMLKVIPIDHQGGQGPFLTSPLWP
jgi:hypothetical protein